MSSSFLIGLYFISFIVHSLSLSLPNDTNPLPPPPPPPPAGPDNYAISGSTLKLRVQRPYGAVLPKNPTILCLASASSALDQQIASSWDKEFPLVWEFEENGVHLVLRSVYREEFHLSDGVIALRGVIEVMLRYPEVGTRAINVMLFDGEGAILGRTEVSRGIAGANTVELSPSSSTSLQSSLTNLTALDPANYHVPNTDVTISVQGSPPYGSTLPRNALIVTLILASSAADEAIRELEDQSLPGLWRYEYGVIGLDVYTDLSVDCTYTVLREGIFGLTDLFCERGGSLGPVAADFVINQDGKGQVAYGRLKYLGSTNTAAAAMPTPTMTLIEQSQSRYVTVIGDAVETGAVGTA